jgi:hypothetical protein
MWMPYCSDTFGNIGDTSTAAMITNGIIGYQRDTVDDEKHDPSFIITKANLICNLSPFPYRDRFSSDSKCSLKLQVKLKNTTDPSPSLLLQLVVYQLPHHQSSHVPDLIWFSCACCCQISFFLFWHQHAQENQIKSGTWLL